MKHKFLLLTATLCTLLLGVGTMWGDEITIKYDDTFDPALPTASASVNTSSTAHTVSGIEIKEQGLYKGSSNNYIMFAQNKGFLYNTTSLGTITKVTATYSSGCSTSAKSGVYFGSAEQSTYTTSSNATIKGQSQTDEWTNSTEGNGFFQLSTSNKNCQITQIVITYTPAGGETKTLTGIEVSGTPSKTSYYAGQNFDPAGLTVTGTYDQGDPQIITSNITWSYNPSQTLALNQTSIGVTATVGNISSEEYNVDVTVTEAPAAANYEKVTSAPADWSGEYLIVYEPSAAKARVWTGVDAVNCYVETDIDNDVVAQPEGTSSVTIASMEEGYSLLVNGGTNDGKYMKNASNNGIVFNATAVANTITYENNAVTITCNNKKFRYNNGSGNDRFRYFGSDQQVVQLYKKVEGTVKPAAGLAYAEADQKKLTKLGDAFTAPTLTNPHSLTVTYASNNTDVAEVASNGAVTIKAAGVAEITASFAGDDDYKSGSASYTIGVTTHAGTEANPYVAADAKIAIDVKGTVENAYATGIVCNVTTSTLPAGGDITFYFSADGTTTGQQIEAYKCLGMNSAPFEAVTDVETGATVVVTGNLKKFNSTYEFDQNCHLVSYTAPAAQKQSIANDQAHPYTVAQAITFAGDAIHYDLNDYVYVSGVVYDVKSFNSTNGTLDIYIKDANAENQFELYKCAGINDGSATTPFAALTDVQAGDVVIGYGQLTVYNTMSELKQGNYLVSLNRPEVAVESVSLPATETVEVGSTVTLTATVLPENASDKSITWSVQSGSSYASVADGVVTGVAEGSAVIRATSVADGTKYAECTVTVNAADPTKHIVTFDATQDVAEEDVKTLTKSNVTIGTDELDGVNTGGNPIEYYQTFKNGKLTVSCSAGNITKIEFTCESSNPVSGYGTVDPTGLNTTTGVWTGNAASVEFTADVKQVRINTITVTYKEDNRAEAGIAWDEPSVELTVGDPFTPQNLTNPHSLTVAIASDNTDLAVVNDGVVSLVADATGTAIITATFAGNEDYKPATVSYTITVNEAGLDNVTFDSSEDHAESGETTITKGGLTLNFTSGSMDGAQAEYRLYKNQTMTLSSSDYLIKKIEFTCTSGNPISGFADAEGLDKANNQWTGEANSVSLTASGNQVRITKLKVYYIPDTRAVSGLAWSTDEVEITLGDAFTPANLVNPNSIAASAITIESDNTNLAVVNDGVVSLEADATGTAHITASFAGNETYKPANISYTIIVHDPTPTIYVDKLNVNFGSVVKDASAASKTITVTLNNVAAVTATLGGTNPEAFSISKTEGIVNNDVITISVVSTATVGPYAATILISDGEEGAEDKTVNLSLTVTEPEDEETPVSTSSKWVPTTEFTDGMEVLITGVKNDVTYAISEQANNNRTVVAGTLNEGVFTPGENTMSFTLVAQSGGTFALRTSNGKYLYAASSSGNQLKTRDAIGEDGKAIWTISIDGENVTSIVANCETANWRNVMQFNKNGTNNPMVACYASANQDAVKLYVPQDTPEPADYTEVRTGLTVDRYYTTCLPRRVTAVKGATFWNLSYRNAAGTVTYIDEATLPFEAGTPFLFQATAAKLEVVYEGDAVTTPVENGALRGILEDLDADAFSALSGNVYVLKDNAIRPRTSGNYSVAERAYILYDELEVLNSMQQLSGRRVRTMPMEPMEPQVTTGINEIKASDKPVKVMIDGQLFILRGDKRYDATGRLVE